MPLLTLIVLPTYQEAANIAIVLRGIRRAVPDARVLVVDDGSPDGTANLARLVGAEVGGVEVLVRPRKSGLGSAYRDGFRQGLRDGYDVLVQMDSDLSHDPAALPMLLAAIEDGAEVAVGSRYVVGGSTRHWAVHRRYLSRWANRYATWALRLPLRDATSGYRAFRATALAGLDVDSSCADGYAFQIEMAYRMARASVCVAEVPIVFAERSRGRSKMSTRIVVEAMALVTSLGVIDRVAASRRRAVAVGVSTVATQ